MKVSMVKTRARQAVTVATASTDNGTAGTSTVTVTVPMHAFRSAALWALSAAGRDDTLPVLAGVRVALVPVGDATTHPVGSDWSRCLPRTGIGTGSGYVVEFAGTDRFRLAYATVVPTVEDAPVDGSRHPRLPAGMAVGILPWRELTDALKSFPRIPARYTNPLAFTVTIVFEIPAADRGTGSARLVTLLANGPDGGTVTRTVRPIDGEFPRYGSLIPSDIGGPGAMAVNPSYLADFAKTAALVNGKGATIRLGTMVEPDARNGFTGKPVMVATVPAADESGAWCSGLLMPVRIP